MNHNPIILNRIFNIWDTLAHPLYLEGFRMTEPIRKAEDEVDRIQAEVLGERMKVGDFRVAVRALVNEIINEK